MEARQAQQKLDNAKKAERSRKRDRKPQNAGVPLWVMQHPVIQVLLCAFMCNHLCDGSTVQWKEFALDETVITHGSIQISVFTLMMYDMRFVGSSCHCCSRMPHDCFQYSSDSKLWTGSLQSTVQDQDKYVDEFHGSFS